MGTVSYTHLDVYKRQLLYGERLQEIIVVADTHQKFSSRFIERLFQKLQVAAKPGQDLPEFHCKASFPQV